MALKIRLRRMGRKKAPTYRIVVAESSSPRDGRFVANLGHYNPRTEPLTLVVDRERTLLWLGKGAMPTDTVQTLLRKAGVYGPAPTVVEGVVDTVKTTAKRATRSAAGAAAKVAGAVASAAGAARETVQDAVGSAVETVGGAVGSAVETVQDAVAGAVEEVRHRVTGEDAEDSPAEAGGGESTTDAPEADKPE
ncbi:MAG: 30S ribosomal protein S16 [Gemmatimonadetes bacterium]|nr:30S ribosomal protein S16 [Gemmatimonadota bacterium]